MRTLVDDGLGLRVGLAISEAGTLGDSVCSALASLNFGIIFLDVPQTSTGFVRRLRPVARLVEDGLNRPGDSHALRHGNSPARVTSSGTPRGAEEGQSDLLLGRRDLARPVLPPAHQGNSELCDSN